MHEKRTRNSTSEMTSPAWKCLDNIAAPVQSNGFTRVRSAFPREWIVDLCERASLINATPSIGGAAGFQVVDYARKILNPCTQMGGNILDVLLYESLINVVEHLMGAECILAQAGMRFDRGVGYDYFPIHADFTAGWKHTGELVLTKKHMKSVLSIGCILYLSASSEGAFTYMRGTHLLGAPKGSEWSDYTREEQVEMARHRVRVEGSCGDLVIFDPRGFHGPDFPSRSPRLAIIFHFYNTSIFGRKQLSPFPIFSSDIGRLTERQIRVLGNDADAFYDPLRYMGNRISGTWAYHIARRAAEFAFYGEHLKRKFLASISRHHL